MSIVDIWQLLKIHNLERVLSERLAIKTAQFAQTMTPKKYGFIYGPLGSEWSRKLRKSKDVEELNALRELLITVKQAKLAGMQCCDTYQCAADELVEERIAEYEKRAAYIEKKNDSSVILPLFSIFLDLFKKLYKPDANEALFNGVNEMARTNKRVAEIIKEMQK